MTILNLTMREHFDTNDFELNEADRKIRLNRQELISEREGNQLSLDDQGKIFMPDQANAPISRYVLTPSNNVQVMESQSEARRMAQIKNGFGIIHLDFTARSSNQMVLFTLPANMPNAASLIELQTFDGKPIWLDAGNRNIYADRLTVNQRYIVNLVGFFR